MLTGPTPNIPEIFGRRDVGSEHPDAVRDLPIKDIDVKGIAWQRDASAIQEGVKQSEIEIQKPE